MVKVFRADSAVLLQVKGTSIFFEAQGRLTETIVIMNIRDVAEIQNGCMKAIKKEVLTVQMLRVGVTRGERNFPSSVD